jgi:2-polyprenyl-3-methyl-5-hydroxy-6-metoxy-1,4-benzoquinol methylase
MEIKPCRTEKVLRHLTKIAHEGPKVETKEAYSIVDCTNCGFIHALMESQINHQDLYTSHFYLEEKPDYIKDNQDDAEWWDFTYGLRIDLVDQIKAETAATWLDIGTGPGYFLDAALKRGKQVTGVEPGVPAAQHAISKGHYVLNSFFDEELATSLGRFDGVHCSEVLEHVPDPLKFLKDIQKTMGPDSILCTVVPNDFSIIQKIYTSKVNTQPKWWIDPPFHLNYFSGETLRLLLNKSGLEVIHETSMFPIDIFLLMGDHYVGNDALGKQSHLRRKNMEMAFFESGNLDILNSLYQEMSKLGLGRELVFFSKLANT